MTIKTPSTFRVFGPYPGVLRQTHVIVSVWQPSAHIWAAEYSILSKRPEEYLLQRMIEFDVTDYPQELEPLNEASMEAEALRQAEIDIILELERLAMELGRPEVLHVPIVVERTLSTPVTLWVTSTFPTSLAKMAQQTKSPKLKEYLLLVMGLKRLSAG